MSRAVRHRPDRRSRVKTYSCRSPEDERSSRPCFLIVEGCALEAASSGRGPSETRSRSWRLLLLSLGFRDSARVEQIFRRQDEGRSRVLVESDEGGRSKEEREMEIARTDG